MVKKAKVKKVRISRKAINEYKANNSVKTKFEYSRINMMNELNWHSAYADVAKMRSFVEKYAETKVSKKAKEAVVSLRDNDISMAMCVIAKLLLEGAKLGDEEPKLKERIAFWVKNYKKPEPVKKKESIKEVPENAAIADVEEALDQFYNSDYKNNMTDFYNLFMKHNQKQVKEIPAYYQPLLKELETNKDATARLSIRQRRTYINFVNKIIDEARAFVENNKKQIKLNRKPRKKKVKSAEQLTSKVQFKQSEPKLKITSVLPSQIVGANAVWLFNTKYARLTYLVAADNQTLSIKGTTVQNFDEKKSLTKKIRKPEKNLSELLNMGKVSMLKSYLSLKTKPIVANGRLNKDTVILKASK